MWLKLFSIGRWTGADLAVCLGIGPCAQPAWGQSVIRGTVTDTQGRPSAHALVTTNRDSLRLAVGGTGAFLLRTIGPGLVTIQVHAVGFFPASRRVIASGQDTISIAFQLEPVPQHLESLAVTAPAPVGAKLQGFEERRREGFGRFVTRDQLAQREQAPLSDVFRMIAGVRLVRRPQACGGGTALASRGAATVQSRMRCTTGERFPWRVTSRST